MKNEQCPVFQVRREGDSPVFAGRHRPGERIKSEIQDGDDVVLRLEAESVLVRNIRRDREGRYSGEVYGFEPSFSLEFGGIRVGETVTFDERNVIGCHTPS